MSTGPGRRWLMTLALAIAAIPWGIAVADSPADGEVIDAVWKLQQLKFVYRGSNTIYTCRGLANKLGKILSAVGARDDLQLREFVCDDTSRVASFQVSLQSPVVASEANIREITNHDAKDELVARVTGEKLATPEDVPRFGAVWKTISFARDRRLRLESHDCELVRQLRKQILPRMSVQVVRDNVICLPSGNTGPPRLTVLALVPAEQAAKAPQGSSD